MENVKVEYSIDKSAAVLAGKSKFGKVVVDLDPATLTDEQRSELVTCSHVSNGGIYQLDRSIGGSSLNSDEERAIFPEIAEPADDVPAQLLNARIALRKANVEKKAAKDAEIAAEKARLKAIDDEVGANPDSFTEGEGVDLKLRSDLRGIPMYGNESVLGNLIALRKSVEDRVRESGKAIKAEQEVERRRLWARFLEAHGEPDQIERFNAGCLPSDERDELAADVVFDSMLKDCPVYEKLREGDLIHDEEDCYGEVKFRGSSEGGYNQATKTLTPNKYGSPVELDSEQWKRFNDVTNRLPFDSLGITGAEITVDKIDLEIRRHTVFCEQCDAETSRLGVRVTIAWNGSSFEREYAL